MTRRTLADRPELVAHLEWMRQAIQDPNVNTRLILGGILDILDALVLKGDK